MLAQNKNPCPPTAQLAHHPMYSSLYQFPDHASTSETVLPAEEWYKKQQLVGTTITVAGGTKTWHFQQQHN